MQSLRADQSSYNRKGVCILLILSVFAGQENMNSLPSGCKDNYYSAKMC